MRKFMITRSLNELRNMEIAATLIAFLYIIMLLFNIDTTSNFYMITAYMLSFMYFEVAGTLDYEKNKNNIGKDVDISNFTSLIWFFSGTLELIY